MTHRTTSAVAARRPPASFLLAALASALAACVGGGGGGGGGGGSATIGGLPDTACGFVGEGCAFKDGVAIRVTCNMETKKWALVAACVAGEVCQSAPNTSPVTTLCKGPSAAADAVSADTASAGDGASGADAVGDAVSDQGGGKDVPVASDGGADGGAPLCGDGVCDKGEFNATCPADCKDTCKPACDGKQCGPNGCGGVCGVCGETKACTDAGKCVAVATVCGNGECEPGETPTSCAKDCKPTCTPNCADKGCGDIDGCGGLCGGACPGGGTCTADKNCAGGSQCGNGSCDPGESNATCAKDCKPDCVPNCGGKQCGPNGCGGVCGLCGSGKACTDDGQCVSLGPVCGNGQCESGETQASCPADCKSTGPVCGNGSCESGESSASCPKDCPSTGGPDSCVGKCGNKSTNCYCDDACTGAGDCCADYKAVCGGGCTLTCAAGATCGSPDGCGGKCAGSCTAGLVCNSSKVCVPNSAKCGNGVCETGETPTSCPSDCKASGGACSGLCGKPSTGCYCDTKCKQSNDCCADYDKYCGGTSTACPNGSCEPGETEASCPQDCKNCEGNFSLGSTFYKSSDTKQTGLGCNPKGAPKNCPDGYWINFPDTDECICILSCAGIGVTVGANCTTDGAWKCMEIKATNASGNSGKMCVPVKWNLCTK